jgi:peptidoglycan/LPS O-acetylase OafA/YrhL
MRPRINRSYATLDGLRGVAAICIVVLHCRRFFMVADNVSMALAVDLFFVLSGFVLAFAYDTRFEQGMTPWEFIKARLIRLYPLYVVGTVLGIVEVVLVIRFAPDRFDGGWHQLLVSLPFALAMLPDPTQIDLFPFNAPMWSIFFELLVNFVWALLWKPLRSTRLLVGIIALSALGVTASAYSWDGLWLHVTWATFLPGLARSLYSFFLGTLLFRVHRSVRLPRVPAIVLLIALPACIAPVLPPAAQAGIVLFVLPWFVLLGSQVEPSGLLRGLSHDLGVASYAIYSLHRRIYMLIYASVLGLAAIDLQLLAPWIGLLFLGLLVPACLLLTRRVDEPIRRWLSRWLGRQARLGCVAEGPTQAP